MDAQLTDREVESLLVRLSFIKNRLDNVGIDVIGWMPPEDNERHHNAVEMLLRAYQTIESIERLLVERSGQRAWPSEDYLVIMARKRELNADPCRGDPATW